MTLRLINFLACISYFLLVKFRKNKSYKPYCVRVYHVIKSLTCLISGVPVFILAPARRAKSRLLLRPCCLMQVTSNFGQMLNTPISWNSSILVDIPRSLDFIAFPTMAILSPIGLIPMNVADIERWYMKSWSYLKLTDKDLNQVRKILQCSTFL